MTVTENTTGLFTFSSVDLVDGLAGSPVYEIEGFLNDAPVFNISGTLPPCLTTINNPDAFQILDTLTITIFRIDETTLVDNIIGTPLNHSQSAQKGKVGDKTLVMVANQTATAGTSG